MPRGVYDHYKLRGRKIPLEILQKRTNRIPREIRFCECNCGGTFECKINSKQRFINGHNKRGKPAWHRGLTKETDSRVAKLSVSRSLETRKKIAIASSKRVMEGVLGSHKFYKNGWVVLDRLGIKIYYRSSYELRALQLLDSYSDVIKVSGESIRIQYKKEDGSTHYYVPDLLVTTADGLNYIIEIKPSYLLEEKNNQIKFEAAKKYVKKHNMIFLVWTENVLFNEDKEHWKQALGCYDEK